jgi:hypothetical protein
MMNALDAARAYIGRRWAPVPVPYRKKKPIITDWGNLRITEADAPRFFNGAPQNVGIILGEASHGLADVDLDTAEAVAVAPYLLPRTEAIFGRAGNRASHWLYVSDVAQRHDTAVLEYRDPSLKPDAKPLVELRIGGGGKAAQTVFPGSVHESGESIDWEERGNPAQVPADVLEAAVKQVAAAALLARHWPGGGARHNAARALGGGLARGAWGAPEAKVFVEAVARAAGDEEWRDRVKAAMDSVAGYADGKKLQGLPTLADLLNERVVTRSAQWLGLLDAFGTSRAGAGTARAGGEEAAKSSHAGATWDDPDLSVLDDRRGELPPFPVESLPAWGDWLRDAANGGGVTPGHVAVPLLSIASSLIGTARRVRASRAWSEPLALWTGIVGFSGTGKTPGIDVTTRALSMIEDSRRNKIADLRRRHEARIEWSKAARKKWKQEVEDAIASGHGVPDMPPEAIDPGPFVAPRLVVSDATTERLAVLLQARPRGLSLVADELAGLFLNMNRYSNGSDREFWLQAWNGRPHVVERQGRPPVDLKYLLVGITGGFQPDKLVKSFGADEDGMYARLLLGWPEESAYMALSNEVEEVEPEFQNALTRLVDLPAEDEDGKLVPRSVWLSDAALREFEQFRQFLHGEKRVHDGREREWMARGRARFSGCPRRSAISIGGWQTVRSPNRSTFVSLPPPLSCGATTSGPIAEQRFGSSD